MSEDIEPIAFEDFDFKQLEGARVVKVDERRKKEDKKDVRIEFDNGIVIVMEDLGDLPELQCYYVIKKEGDVMTVSEGLKLYAVSISGVERFEDVENYFVSTIYVIAESEEQAKELALDSVVAEEIDEVKVEEVSMTGPQVLGRC